MSKETINDGGPAFPRPPFTPGSSFHNSAADAGFAATGAPGMTLRDYFAAATLQVLLSCHSIHSMDSDIREEFAEEAYKLADAMLAERAKRNGGAS